MTSNEKTAHPARRVIGVEDKVVSTLEENPEHIACLHAGERCTDAMVDAAPERNVTTWEAPLEIDLVGSFELVWVPVAGAPEQ